MYEYTIHTHYGALTIKASSHFRDATSGDWHFYGQKGGDHAVVSASNFCWFMREELTETCSENRGPSGTSGLYPGLPSDNVGSRPSQRYAEVVGG
jgi:hypothetical protein